MEHLNLFAAALIQSVAQSAPYVVIGYLIAALIREYVPLATMTRLFARRGVRPLLTSAGIGALLPMCSCTVIPLAVGLVRAGAARGTILPFLVTAPVLSPVAIVLALSLLGPTMTLLYVGTCVIGALVLGIIGQRLLRGSEDAFRATVEPAPSQVATTDRRPWHQRLRSAGRWAFWDLGTEVSVDLLIGLTLAAVVLSLLPMSWIATWLGSQHFATLIYVILIGIPVYTCSVPSLPVVQSLLLAGMSPGAAVAYLIAGPATNLGELLVLRRQIGSGAMWLFTGGLVAIALAGGLIADHVIYAGYTYTPTALAGAAPVSTCCVTSIMPVSARPLGPADAAALVPLWHWPFVIVLAATMGCGLVRRIHRRVAGLAPLPHPEPVAS
jgi:uncharacterized membrane protein YraQ (UPF0718 family)